jgi:hypothetical protein
MLFLPTLIVALDRVSGEDRVSDWHSRLSRELAAEDNGRADDENGRKSKTDLRKHGNTNRPMRLTRLSRTIISRLWALRTGPRFVSKAKTNLGGQNGCRTDAFHRREARQGNIRPFHRRL